ncbi:hypothetical protein LCGC14_1283660 [marine sediment metagenome]|uniref:Uncharacterized protein n=1 Tax=marine sediment metagenome TaxID=412755 RepID=A0A0F9LFJ6_9ZZZZ
MHNHFSGPEKRSTTQTTPPYFGFTPAHARLLNHKTGTPYKMLTDKHGIEWLVNFVVDHGRFMELIMVGTAGKVRRVLTSSNYIDYTITLGPEDM